MSGYSTKEKASAAISYHKMDAISKNCPLTNSDCDENCVCFVDPVVEERKDCVFIHEARCGNPMLGFSRVLA